MGCLVFQQGCGVLELGTVISHFSISYSTGENIGMTCHPLGVRALCLSALWRILIPLRCPCSCRGRAGAASEDIKSSWSLPVLRPGFWLEGWEGRGEQAPPSGVGWFRPDPKVPHGLYLRKTAGCGWASVSSSGIDEASVCLWEHMVDMLRKCLCIWAPLPGPEQAGWGWRQREHSEKVPFTKFCPFGGHGFLHGVAFPA